MGGITLNTWVAALFYEPVDLHMKKIPKNTYNDSNDIIDEEDEGITLEFSNQPENNTDGINSKITFAITSDELSITENQRKNGEFIRSVSAVAVPSFKNVNDDRHRKISTPVRSGTPKNDSFINQLSSTSRLNQYRSGGRPPKRSPSTSSFLYVSTPYHGSTLSFQPEEFASHLSLKSIASSINPMAACSKQKTEIKSKFLDLSLLKDPVYLVILISNCTNAIGYTNFIILLPTFATTLGFDKNRAAYLLSIVSVFDLVGRIGGSALSDWTTFIPKTWYFVWVSLKERFTKKISLLLLPLL